MQIRKFEEEDEFRVLTIYKEAFENRPWWSYQDDESLRQMWRRATKRPGFTCFVALVEDQVVAMTWYESITLSELRKERGEVLRLFAQVYGGCRPLVWIRGTTCDAWFKNRGITRKLKRVALQHLWSTHPRGALVFTRMREDNSSIIRINSDLGFRHTGMRVSSPGAPEVVYGYWTLGIDAMPITNVLAPQFCTEQEALA